MIIKNIGTHQGVDYDLKYDNSWQSKMKEHFKIGEIIHGVHCFVKRYDQRVPTANLLLNRLTKDTANQIAVSNLPKVYDLAERTEGHKRVYYYVTECLEGLTLDAFLKQQPAASLNLKLLYLHLSKAFDEIHRRDFWFSDFNDQNILYNPQLPCFYLIDVDSCWSKEDKPTGDAAAIGGLPGASLKYAGLVEMIYRTKLKLPNFSYNQLAGSTLNYLQLLVFIAHLRHYQKLQVKDKQLPFGQSLHQATIIDGIYEIDPMLCQSIFDKAMRGKPDFSFLNDLGKYVDKIIAFDTWGSEKPRILKFESSVNQLAKGQTTQLQWFVEDAAEIHLKGGDFGSQKVSAQGKQTVTIHKATTFVLTATNNKGSIEQKVELQLNADQTVEIISFKSSIVQKDLIINSRDTVHLTWIVLGSKPDGITLNGNVMPKNRGKATLNPTRTTTYTLVATDIHGKTEQEAITIKVQQNVSVWKWVVGVMVSAACLLGGYTLLDNYWIDSIPLEKAFETGKSAYRNGQYKKARRLMTRCIDKNEHRSEAYYWRGVAFLKTKNHGEGCKDIQQAAKSLPNDRNVKDACATQCNCN